ncbi:preprotein translocase subunit SecE [Rhodococcus jostii]|uniref:preprotein translocase subunit SecE n=1 Tax=Rhodococcus jostii TaxID=132919 RepID=UPI00362BB956
MSDQRSKDGGMPGLVSGDGKAGTSTPSGKPRRKHHRRAPAGGEPTAGSTTSKPGTKTHPKILVTRVHRFLRQVIAELRKVIWPNRAQMITYTSVVLVFVVFMVTFIGVLDLAVIKGVTWLFG